MKKMKDNCGKIIEGPTPVISVLEELSNAIYSLDKAFTDLVKRLDFILQRENPEVEMDPSKLESLPGEQSELETHIVDRLYKVITLRKRVEDVQNRLRI
jgi:predicted nuclease with TOPRIM domain